MSDTTGISVDRRAPEEVFGLLGNELRVAILRALADDPTESKSFSELRERVGERDSGKFNYHLRKLDGVLVRRDDDGYELTTAGMQLVGALVAGTYTAEAEIEPIELDDPCPACGGGPLVVTYRDEHAQMDCAECDDWYSRFSFPPGTLDQYDREELPAAFDRWLWSLFQRVTSGFCANCAGRLSGEIRPEREPPVVEWTCERCNDLASASPSLPVLYHPATQGFLYDHGVDPSTTPNWRRTSSRDVDVVADGDGATVTLTLEGDTLTATVDAAGRVTSVDRSDR